MSATRRVCLFGTSANPPTGEGGHTGIITHLSSLKLKSGENEQQTFDEVRVLPVYKHMFQEKRGNQASYEDRLSMCKLAFSHMPNVVVSDEERKCFDWVASKKGITASEDKQNLSVGTADLLDMLIEQNSSVEYTLALGDDTFMDLSRWKWRRSKEIIEILEGRIVIFRRLTNNSNNNNGDHINQEKEAETSTRKDTGKSDSISEDKLLERIHLISDELSESCPNLKENIRIMSVQLSAISSSLARACQDEEALSNILDDNILKFIKDNKMYAFRQN